MNVFGVAMKKKLFIYLMVIFASLFSQVSLAFDISLDRMEATVDTSQTAEFKFTVSSAVADRLVVRTKGMKTWMTIEDVGSIEAGETKNFSLYASPDFLTSIGTYKVDVTVQSVLTNQTIEKSIFITVIKSVFAGIDKIYVSGNLKPAGDIYVKVNVRNFGTVSMQNIIVSTQVYSPARQIESFVYAIPQIEPQELITVEKVIALGPGAESGTYTVVSELFYQDKTFSRKEQQFEVVSTPVLVRKVEDKTVFIGSTRTIKITNYGNDVAKNVVVNETLDGFARNFFFASSGPKPYIQGGMIFWNVGNILPGQTVVVAYQINYLPLVVVIIILLLALWFVLFKVRVLDVRKEVMKKGSDITIKLEVKNRTGKDIDSVILKDSLPLIFRVREFVGLKPIRKRTEEGTDVIWRIRKLKANEERIFSYKIMPVIGVTGSINLPRAKIMYKDGGKFFSRKSNSPLL